MVAIGPARLGCLHFLLIWREALTGGGEVVEASVLLVLSACLLNTPPPVPLAWWHSDAAALSPASALRAGARAGPGSPLPQLPL